MLDLLIDAVVDNVPWEEVGEWALGAGVAALAAIGVDVGLRKLTGKGLFGHMRSAVLGIEDSLHKWIQEQGASNGCIKKLVFIVELCSTPVELMDKGLRLVEVAILGVSADGSVSVIQVRYLRLPLKRARLRG